MKKVLHLLVFAAVVWFGFSMLSAYNEQKADLDDI